MEKKNKKALIFGISGQDGSYLASFLFQKGYQVHGTSRDPYTNKLNNLHALEIFEAINVHTVDATSIEQVRDLIEFLKPDEIYNLSGQSSVSKSFLTPQDTFYSITLVSLNILQTIKFLKINCKFYNASSSECFGDTGNVPSNEKTKFNPCSPYGVAKSSAFWLTKNYRKAYNIFACSGILFNHESPLRPEEFVTKKIIRTAIQIYFGNKVKLKLGDLSIKRDWGWAPEYVEAMWLILQNNEPEDFVISTGRLSSLKYFVEFVFTHLNLNFKEHVSIDESLFRPSELKSSFGNSSKAKSLLGWEAKNKIEDVIKKMIDFEISKFQDR